jgi:hypothetical protein
MTELTLLRDRDFYESDARLQTFLGSQLYRGRLAVILGAGVSLQFDLPGWTELVRRVAVAAGTAVPAGLENALEDAAEVILTKSFKGDRPLFAAAVREALYEKCDVSFAALRRNNLLAALAALVMTSSRGSMSGVVTFNFDDVLETYLTYHGFDVEAVAGMPTWSSRTDVRVYHPHGLLPLDRTADVTPLVFTRRDFDAVVGKTEAIWRQVLLAVMRSSTCLFLGLSGADANLTSLLDDINGREDVKATHPARLRGDLFWGVRFTESTDSRLVTWENRGVFNVVLPTYDDLPDWLFSIAQRAAAMRRVEVM